jgi:Ca-activated chloride channel homolog
MRQSTPEEADKAVLALALEHQLVTRLTSLVAVDKTPSRPDGETLKLAELPLNLPNGWEFEKVFGERLRTAPLERRAEDAQVQHAVLKRSPVPAATNAAVMLPKTATDADIKLAAGAILLGIALVLFMITRRQYRPL